MLEWLTANNDWFFSGMGVAILTAVVGFLLRRANKEKVPHSGIVINNNASVATGSYQNSHAGEKYLNSVEGATAKSPGISSNVQGEEIMKPKRSLESFKNETKILFIDDDARFKVAKILAKSGWVHTKLIKDALTLDDNDVTSAHILFIDVQGVGVEMGFVDEGLGLALAIKEKYPEKKVVIYSAETKGDRFHAALRKADSFLPKNADPYEFQKIVEDFTVGSN